jgi:hypothetical protein
MRIPSKIYANLPPILQNSIEKGIEQGGLMLYDPKVDLVKAIVLPEEMRKQGLTKNSTDGILLDDTLHAKIREFNLGGIRALDICGHALRRKDGVIIDYHTHPLEGQGIAPSDFDTNYAMIGMNTGSEIILSYDAIRYGIPGAFTFAHHIKARNYLLPRIVVEKRKEGELSNSKHLPPSEFEEISRETGISIDAFVEAAQSEHKNELLVSFNLKNPESRSVPPQAHHLAHTTDKDAPGREYDPQ